MKIQNLLESKQDIENFINKFGQETYDLFIKSKDRLKNNKLSTDLTWHTKNTTPEEMDNMLASLQQKVGGNKDLSKTDFSEKQIPGKYKYFGRMGNYDVYQPLDYISSMALGVNTGWCTTGRYGHYGDPNFKPSREDAKKHWNDYTSKGIKFYYLLDPKTHYGEIAVAKYPKVLDYYDANIPDVIETKNELIQIDNINFEIFNAKDDNDYSQIDDLPNGFVDKFGLVIDYEIILDKRKMPKIQKESIKGITLLSIDEAENLSDYILRFPDWWWLKSPGDDGSCVKGIRPNGEIGFFARPVNFNLNAVRPILLCSNLKPLNLKIGDYVSAFDKTWQYIGNDMILLFGEPLTEMAFRKDYKAQDATVYEKSDIKKYLDNWLREQMSKNESLKQRENKQETDMNKTRKMSDGPLTEGESIDRVLTEWDVSEPSSIELGRAIDRYRQDIKDRYEPFEVTFVRHPSDTGHDTDFRLVYGQGDEIEFLWCPASSSLLPYGGTLYGPMKYNDDGSQNLSFTPWKHFNNLDQAANYIWQYCEENGVDLNESLKESLYGEDRYLYHATDEKFVNDILKNGLLIHSPNRNWKTIDTDGAIHFAFDAKVAEHYATIEEIPPEKIVVLKVKLGDLDQSYMEYDWNNYCEYEEDINSVQYKKDIPAKCIEVCNPDAEPSQTLEDFEKTPMYYKILDTFDEEVDENKEYDDDDDDYEYESLNESCIKFAESFYEECNKNKLDEDGLSVKYYIGYTTENNDDKVFKTAKDLKKLRLLVKDLLANKDKLDTLSATALYVNSVGDDDEVFVALKDEDTDEWEVITDEFETYENKSLDDEYKDIPLNRVYYSLTGTFPDNFKAKAPSLYDNVIKSKRGTYLSDGEEKKVIDWVNEVANHFNYPVKKVRDLSFKIIIPDQEKLFNN